jgi:uncharacterized FlaG/YvyC family protein
MDPMTDYTVSSVGRQTPERAEPLPPPKKEESKPVETKTKPDEPEKQPVEINQNTAAMTAFRIQFQVDPKTSDVVILIKDQATDKVVRTIPADAIKDLPPGQLLDVFS